MIKGRVYRLKIKNRWGSTDIDVIGPKGELVTVGGPAKAQKGTAWLGNHLKVITEEALQRGVTAKAAFAKGTPQSLIDLSVRKLGAENVIIF